MTNWTAENQPFGQNRAPLLAGLSSTDGVTPVPVAVVPSTGAILTSGGGGSSGVQYIELSTTSPATGTLALGRYSSTLPTLTNAQMNEPMLDSSSRLLITPQVSRELVGMQALTFTANTSSETVVTAASSGVYTDILSIVLANTGASTTNFTLSDGTNTYTYEVPSADMRGAVYQVPLAATTAATAWTGQCGTSTSSLICTITYAKNT